jgi:hypothetical protein
VPSAKSGKACTLVAPTAPPEAQEADVADPGEVSKLKSEQRQTGKGKYGSVQAKSHKPEEKKKDEEKKTTWIEIELIDEDDNPVPGEQYAITLPDGETVASGTLDDKGLARVEGIEPGTCKISFPRLDKNAWEKA